MLGVSNVIAEILGPYMGLALVAYRWHSRRSGEVIVVISNADPGSGSSSAGGGPCKDLNNNYTAVRAAAIGRCVGLLSRYWLRTFTGTVSPSLLYGAPCPEMSPMKTDAQTGGAVAGC